MPKPITELTKDLRKFIEEGRAAAGPKIVMSLQKEGPWWTGNFGELWELGMQPIKPTVNNKREWEKLSSPSPRNISERPALKVPFGSPLYIGNLSDYAGFAVNRSGAKKDGQTYAEFARDRRITPREGVRWYDVYTLNGGLLDDLNKGFASVQIR